MNETLIAPKAEIPTGQKSLVLNPTIEHQRAPIIEARMLKMFVVDDGDLGIADARDIFTRNALTECLVATALTRMGYSVADCGFMFVTIDGVLRKMTNASTLVDDFIHRRMSNVRACLPFVVELVDETSVPSA